MEDELAFYNNVHKYLWIGGTGTIHRLLLLTCNKSNKAETLFKSSFTHEIKVNLIAYLLFYFGIIVTYDFNKIQRDFIYTQDEDGTLERIECFKTYLEDSTEPTKASTENAKFSTKDGSFADIDSIQD